MSGRRRGRSGYRPGYSEQHSPFWSAGRADAEADAARVANGEDPQGMDPAKAWSVMYQRGYGAIGGGSEATEAS